MEARHDAGRFRLGPGHACRPRGHGALPGGHVPAFEHAVCGRDARGERGMRVRGVVGDLRAYRPGAVAAGVRQRDGRGAPCRVGQGRRGQGVPVVLRASSRGGAVLQSAQRLGEGQRGERGRVPAPQPHGPAAQRGGVSAVGAVAAVPLRRVRRACALPAGQDGLRPVR